MSGVVLILLALVITVIIILVVYYWDMVKKFFTGVTTAVVSTTPTTGTSTTSTPTTSTSTSTSTSISTPVVTAPVVVKPPVKPRMTNFSDKGWSNMTKGWYDMQNQGVRNDYCRYVGDSPNIWFSCALAGATDQYTTARIYDPNLPHDPA